MNLEKVFPSPPAVHISIKPHQALDYKTPLQFLKDNGIIQVDKLFILSHIVVNEYNDF